MVLTSISTYTWLSCLMTLLSVSQQVLAYRPVQHCKTIGDNGHYSACAAITQHYNTTTEHSDLYLRYHWFRWRNSKNGWHSFALGEQMAGALMLIMYGDPNTPALPMTVDVRTSEGHSPPVSISTIQRLANLEPVVEVVTAVFEKYNGDIHIQTDGGEEKPSHVGIAEVIIRNYERWTPAKPSNTSTGMDFLWASNFDQNMNNDFSHGRNIDMHQFGLGFGFLYVDMLNAVVPDPMFGPISELAGMKGAAEVHQPDPPTPEELSDGAKYIEQQQSGTGSSKPTATSSATPATTKEAETQPPNGGQEVEQPVRNILGKTVRDWMWHLHGLLMTIAFLALYPLGTYLIRSPNSTAFNLHWTIQSLGTVALVIGTLIGYINSHSISIKHQYIGLFMFFAVAAQIVLGWRHHVQFVTFKRKGWLSKTHIILGRIILPLGYINIVLGMQLRGYGWFTMTLVVVLMALESVFLVYVLSRASKARGVPSDLRGNNSGPPVGDDAEEYFQLAGEDEFSDSDGENDEAGKAKEQEKKDRAERLRRLDKV